MPIENNNVAGATDNGFDGGMIQPQGDAGANPSAWALRELLGKADSRDYQPDHRDFFQRPRDLPPLNFWLLSQMLVDPTIKLGLKARAAPLCNPYFGWLGDDGETWNSGVQADSEPVKAFVERQLAKVWEYIGEITQAQIYGWSGGEWTTAQTLSGTVELNEFYSRHSYDIRALVRDGKPRGVRVLNCKGASNGYVDLKFPRGLFHAHCPEPGHIYGRRIVDGAYSPWMDKASEGGGLDVRRLFMKTSAYGGADMTYPPGVTVINGVKIPNADIARRVVETIQSGGVTTRPFEESPSGKNKWDLTRAVIPANPQHILQYPKDTDVEILRGLEVPDDILTAESSGAWAGKVVIMQAFYTSLDVWLGGLVRDVVNQVVRPLVWMNFGPGNWFQVKTKPLALIAIETSKGAGGTGGGQALDAPGGQAGGDPEAQVERMVGMGLLRAADTVTAARRAAAHRRAAKRAQRMATAEAKGEDLFGRFEQEKSTWGEQADAAGKVGDNKLDTAANKARRGDKGPIADVINECATKYANATTKRERDRIKEETLERVRAAIDGELGRLDRGELELNPAGGGGGAERTPGAGAETASSNGSGPQAGANESGPGSDLPSAAGLDDYDAGRESGKQYASAPGQGGLFGDSVEQPTAAAKPAPARAKARRAKREKK